jgi:hypothetical protein
MKLYSLANYPILSYISLSPILYRIFCCLYRIFHFNLYCNTSTYQLIEDPCKELANISSLVISQFIKEFPDTSEDTLLLSALIIRNILVFDCKAR